MLSALTGRVPNIATLGVKFPALGLCRLRAQTTVPKMGEQARGCKGGLQEAQRVFDLPCSLPPKCQGDRQALPCSILFSFLPLTSVQRVDGKRKGNVSERNQEHVHGGPGQVGAGQQEARLVAHVGLELAGLGKCHGMEGG